MIFVIWAREKSCKMLRYCALHLRFASPVWPDEREPPSRAGALAAPDRELDRAVGDGEAEGRADGAFDQADVAAMGAHQLGRDGKAEAGAAGAGRALESLEQMRARPLGKPGPVSDTSITTTAPSRRPVMRIWSRPGSFGRAASSACTRVAGEIEEDAEQLVGVGIDHEPALDRADPAHRRVGSRPSVSRTSSTSGSSATGLRDQAGAPARGRRTASIGRTRWRARARASAWAQSAARRDRAGWPADRRKLRRGRAGCAGRG